MGGAQRRARCGGSGGGELAVVGYVKRQEEHAMESSSKRESITDTLLQRMQTDPPAGVSASPVSDNVMTWYVGQSLTLSPPRFASCDGNEHVD